MNSEISASSSELNDSNNNSHNESISVRLARYLEHIQHLNTENTSTLLQEAETRLVQQQEQHANDLEELRARYETQLQVNRENLEKFLTAKLKLTEEASQSDKNAREHALKTLSLNENMIGQDQSRLRACILENSTLNETIRNLQASIEAEHLQGDELNDEIKRLQRVLASKIEQCKQVEQEDKDEALHVEIAAFDALLSQEEKRIKLLEATGDVHQQYSGMESSF